MPISIAGPSDQSGQATLHAYEPLAPLYDRFTAAYDHERWLSAVEKLAREQGLAGRRLLDVGCGSGKSFLPMLARGYEVTACDISPAMVEEARRKVAGRAHVVVADMRSLPPLGEFDLITCLDDAVNYLLDDGDLTAALASMGSLLTPEGVLVFDTNTLHTYRSIFSTVFAHEDDGAFFCWRGEGDPDCKPGSVCAATIEAFASARGPLWSRASSRHVQRHYPRAEVMAALSDALLECAAVKGQSPGVRVSDEPDESLHTKLIYVAKRREVRPWSSSRNR
jgi:SAM-dependent methyltransferase